MSRSDSVPPAAAERPLALALDIGSSSVKGALHDARSRSVQGTETQVAYAWDLGAGGGVRLPVDRFHELVEATIDGVVAAGGELLADVAVAGISCFIHSIVGLDAAERPVTPALSWADTTSAADATALRERLDPEAVRSLTGAPLHAGYWPARIVALRRDIPTIRRWSGLAELIVERLTGVGAASRSMASGTGLLDRAQGTWATSLLEALNVDPRDLPPITADDQPAGALAGDAARRWPGLARIAWFAAWGDGPASNVGLGATTGAAALLVGTSGALRVFVDDPSTPLPAGLFAQRLGSGAIVGGQLSEGGGVIAWARELLGSSAASLERRAAALEPGANGVTVLPYLYGERGLGYRAGATGAIVGLTAGVDAAAVYRAVLESVALSFAGVDDRLSELLGSRPEVIAAGGGLDGSPLLAQVLADVLGRDIRVAPRIESSRRGAAVLALRSVGHSQAAFEAVLPGTKVVRSHPDRAERYRAAMVRRQEAARALLG